MPIDHVREEDFDLEVGQMVIVKGSEGGKEHIHYNKLMMDKFVGMELEIIRKRYSRDGFPCYELSGARSDVGYFVWERGWIEPIEQAPVDTEVLAGVL